MQITILFSVGCIMAGCNNVNAVFNSIPRSAQLDGQWSFGEYLKRIEDNEAKIAECDRRNATTTGFIFEAVVELPFGRLDLKMLQAVAKDGDNLREYTDSKWNGDGVVYLCLVRDGEIVKTITKTIHPTRLSV